MDGAHGNTIDRWSSEINARGYVHMNVQQEHDSDSHQLVSDMVDAYNVLKQDFTDE
jgi:hypothetical protein